jgi:hypothetical protein
VVQAQDDSRVKSHVRAAAREIASTFQVADIQGYSFRDIAGTNTLSDHAKGLAIDVMGSVKGQQIANWVTQNAARLGVTYVIWSRHIWDSRNNKGWTNYSGVNPHTDHVHISFYPEGSGTVAEGTPFSQNFGGENSAGASGCTSVFGDIFKF